MARDYKFTDEQRIINYAVPPTTDSYVAIPNKLLLDSVYQKIAQAGLGIRGKEFKSNATGQVSTGRIFLDYGDSEMGMTLGFINSYDKSKRLGVAGGGNVWVCSNGMFVGDVVALRKHTGVILEDLDHMLTRVMGHIECEFKNAVSYRETFKRIELPKSAINEIIGELYLEEELIKSDQLSIIKTGLISDPNFRMTERRNMWRLYNLVTEALKAAPAGSYLENHIKFNRFMLDRVQLLGGTVPPKFILHPETGQVIQADNTVIQAVSVTELEDDVYEDVENSIYS